MEFGPRALGSRSIIGDARSPKMQKKMNLKIKYRESFRPFAPAVLAEDVAEYFEIDRESPYMLLTADVQQAKRIGHSEKIKESSPDKSVDILSTDRDEIIHDFKSGKQKAESSSNYVGERLDAPGDKAETRRGEALPRPEQGAEQEKLWGIDQLNLVRSTIPAVTHVDYSARLQTVHRETNPAFYQLLSAFKEQTGCPVLVNTSFNVRGEPIVCTPGDAYRCFMRTEMDYLVLGRFLLKKEDQPVYEEKEDWKEEFELD
jgi:carbamoyltransferase